MVPADLIATYRLQMNSNFTFADAAKVVPYLRDLGISHLYLSPVWSAVPGSQHGYDVTDHSRVNEELGGLSGLNELARVAHEHDLGMIFDIVPNHVGIASHPWWRDVLRFGATSRFAPYFDIDWEGQPQQTTGVLVYPVLGQPFGRALEAGEFRLAFDGAEIVVCYYDRSFPITPAHYLRVLGIPPTDLPAEASRELVSLLEGMSTAASDAAALLLERFAALAGEHPPMREWIERRLATYDGKPGDPASFDQLDALLTSQHYRLAYWRVSAEEINYRRFFDINELAAIRVEHEPTFVDTHEMVGQLIAGAIADGLRIDHIDGLYDPNAYLVRLRQLAAERGAPEGMPHIWVEKILARDEQLPAHWPIEGASGYEFLAVAGGLLIDGSSEQAFTATYEDFVGSRLHFDDVAFAARRRIAGRSFAGEVNVLALQLYRLAQARRDSRDITLGSLRDATASMLAGLPVYRTYLHDDQPMERDESLILAARDNAVRRDPNLSEEAIAFLVQVLMLDGAAHDERERERWRHFRRRFQQLSGPVMAKGVEDTSFFRYHRLLATNEVGDAPEYFGITAEAAHAFFEDRARNWPLAMNGTSTHDTKRSEDARMRLAALSGLPRQWHSEVRAWARMNARHHRLHQGADTPDRNTEYYIYQTLIASWEGTPTRAYRDRIKEHMVKAMREAKLQTSWARVDEDYENTVNDFVEAILDRRKSRRFVQRLDQFVSSLEPPERINSLALLTLKCTAPGVPDFYQGAEFPVHSLTDPDNRRPVDFEGHAARMGPLRSGERPPPGTPEVKAWLAACLLELRRTMPALFAVGNYRPMQTSGDAANHLFAFAREHDDQAVIVAVPRNVARFLGPDGAYLSESWGNTTLRLPKGRWKHWLTREQVGSSIQAATLFAAFPVAILVREGGQ